MAKVNQKLVKEKLEEWAALQTKVGTLETKRQRKLEPFIRQYNEETKPIQEEFETKSAPIREKANALAAEINVLLGADRDADGNPKPVLVSSDAAVASIERKDGSRTIDPQKFFNMVKNKTPKFWECVSILVGKAKDVISENEIDELSTKKTSFPFSISLKK
jgi:hypothetical protein